MQQDNNHFLVKIYRNLPVNSMYDRPWREESKMAYITSFDFSLGESDGGGYSKSIALWSTSSSELVSVRAIYICFVVDCCQFCRLEMLPSLSRCLWFLVKVMLQKTILLSVQ